MCESSFLRRRRTLVPRDHHLYWSSNENVVLERLRRRGEAGSLSVSEVEEGHWPVWLKRGYGEGEREGKGVLVAVDDLEDMGWVQKGAGVGW